MLSRFVAEELSKYSFLDRNCCSKTCTLSQLEKAGITHKMDFLCSVNAIVFLFCACNTVFKVSTLELFSNISHYFGEKGLNQGQLGGRSGIW